MQECVYLDNAGLPLIPEDLVDSVFQDLKRLTLGNPHSRNSISQTTTDLVDNCRDRILRFFNTTSDEYTVIFTNNCTGALKLIGESFDWTKCAKCAQNNLKPQNSFVLPQNYQNFGPQFVYTVDNHTSVVGIREYALRNEAFVFCVNDAQVQTILSTPSDKNVTCTCNKLFAYPAQSNFCGRKYPLEWISAFRENSNNCNWFVCLDAAAFVPSSKLDLCKFQPDFITVSFYKVFGYPTGLGALVIKNSSANVLKKRYFGGGTAASYLPCRNLYNPRKNLSDRYEDGTIALQQILALKQGFLFIDKRGGQENVGQKVFTLAKVTYTHLSQMFHSNGNKVAKIYCHGDFKNFETQGPIINFNLLRSDGTFVGYAEVEKMAELYNIIFRTGCFCNQGACQTYLQTTDEQLMAYMEGGKECGDVMDIIDGQPLGSVRISFGMLSSDADVKRFLKMIYDCFLEKDIANKSFDAFFKEIGAAKSDLAICQGETRTNEMSLTDILIFPIKSCGAIKASKWPLSNTGLLFDRHWMVTNEDGLCLSQKREPSLTKIKPTLSKDWKTLQLNAENCDSCTVNIISPAEDLEGKKENNFLTTSPTCQTKVCADRVSTSDSGDITADWISLVLNRSFCRLVSQLENFPRLSKKTTNDSDKKKAFVSLANEEQYLLVNRASIRKLLNLIKENHSEITEDDLVARFRPNLVMDGALPFEEDSWKEIKIGNLTLKVSFEQTSSTELKFPNAPLRVSMKKKVFHPIVNEVMKYACNTGTIFYSK